MITTERNDFIAQARRSYLAAHPLRTTAVPSVDSETGKPGADFVFPNIGDMQIIGCKLGMEYLAICHDDDLVDDWINTAIGIGGKDPEAISILLANVFRGMNLLIANILDRNGLRDHMQRQAVEAWRKDFSEPFPDAEPAVDNVDAANLNDDEVW